MTTEGRLPLILASASPRRRELMGLITRDFTVRVSAAYESLAPGTAPGEAVEELALRKARAVYGRLGPGEEALVVGSDTVVAVDGRILGKPRDREDCLKVFVHANVPFRAERIVRLYGESEVEPEKGLENNLLELIAADPAFGLSLEDLKKSMDPSRYVGRAPRQVEEFLTEVVNPILDANRDVLGMKAEINV